MKNVSLTLIALVILHIEYLCLVGLIQFTDGHTPVRLVNPNSSLPIPYVGRLEAFYDGTWRSVCANNFTDAAARVVCNSLGFGRTGKVIRNLHRPGSEQIWLHDVNCAGSETSIDNCSRIEWGTRNCQVSIECDIDECTTRRSRCDERTTICLNTFGSYQCQCRGGHRRINSTSCEDKDECTNGESRCDSSSTTCVNTVGSYRCDCNNGYRYSSFSSCTDIDECSNRQSLCDSASGTCVNTAGSFRCLCRNGFENNDWNRRYEYEACTDINECSTGQHVCDSASTICVNTVGSYRCHCRNGFENNYWNSRNYEACRDINECASGRSQCDAATTKCVNTVGSYNCLCKKGFKYSNFSSCTETDECENGDQLCDKTTTICINSTGSYQCVCRAGYKRENNTVCSDIDECISGDSECDLMSTDCTNTIGGNYTCSCKDGFTYLNETTCLTVKESSQPSQGRAGFGAIVGLSVGIFLVVASAATLFLVFYWKRRKEVNQPQQTESSDVDNGPGVANSDNTKIYETLNQTPLEMRRNETIYTQLNPRTLLPVSH